MEKLQLERPSRFAKKAAEGTARYIKLRSISYVSPSYRRLDSSQLFDDVNADLPVLAASLFLPIDAKSLQKSRLSESLVLFHISTST